MSTVEKPVCVHVCACMCACMWAHTCVCVCMHAFSQSGVLQVGSVTFVEKAK